MIRRPLLIAAAFAVSALVLVGGLVRITLMTLDLERSERAALERATHEENVRIALWRLDATLATLIASENTRPAARFRSHDERAGLPLLAAPTERAASAEPVGPVRLVRARFEIGADRQLRIQPPVTSPNWVATLPIPEQPPAAKARDPWALLRQTPGVQLDRINATSNQSGQQSAYSQEALNTLSYQRRQELGRQSTLVRPASSPPGFEVESAFEAQWTGGDLILLRRVRRGDARLLQGTWLDWPTLHSFLMQQIDAVVPSSRLEPVGQGHDGRDADPGRRLALLPARLIPGPMIETEPPDWTPVRLSLAAAWVAVLLALVGVGSLLKGSVALSQRRADFVSAVTHELRTPLTTFRLYTEMLLEDMVPAAERTSYLATLKREGDRLGHLVDNVLAFSRLERRTAAATHIESLPLADLLARVVPGLTERAGQAGLTLEVTTDEGLAEQRVRVDLASAEQILLNLVDNACKYAVNPERPTLHLAVLRRGRYVVIQLRDHGPGIEPRERRRIFRPFHRPASHAVDSAPGVGLGLALSRRLARRMKGDLRLVDAPEGAAFEVWVRAGGER